MPASWFGREACLAGVLFVSGCAWWTANRQAVLSDANKVCILTNAMFPNETIRTICGIEGEIAEADRIIEAAAMPQRAALAAAKRVGFDEGMKTAGGCRSGEPAAPETKPWNAKPDGGRP